VGNATIIVPLMNIVAKKCAVPKNKRGAPKVRLYLPLLHKHLPKAHVTIFKLTNFIVENAEILAVLIKYVAMASAVPKIQRTVVKAVSASKKTLRTAVNATINALSFKFVKKDIAVHLRLLGVVILVQSFKMTAKTAVNAVQNALQENSVVKANVANRVLLTAEENVLISIQTKTIVDHANNTVLPDGIVVAVNALISKTTRNIVEYAITNVILHVPVNQDNVPVLGMRYSVQQIVLIHK